MKLIFATLMLLACALPVFAQQEEPILPDIITFEAPAGLQPEGVVWDEEHGRFLVGSLLDGTIGSVDDEGVYTPLFTDESFVATTGVHIADGKLYIANTSPLAFIPGMAGLASLFVYDLVTDEVIVVVNLNEVHDGDGARFANDVAVDADGNAYVTDSFQPVIYRVTPEGETSVLVESDLLKADFLGMNGIDYHPDGYLLVAVSGNAALVRVPLDDPDSLTVVEWDTASGIDGMALAPDGTMLYAVSRLEVDGEEVQAVTRYESEDDWQTATLTGMSSTTGATTTLTLRGQEVYSINAYLQDFGRTEYQITRATFD